MQNKTFQKATRLLCSPVSLGAMLLLFLNDHILRVYAPSWWTGKLGDFAWLFFFPFALAAFLALLIPARVPHQEKIAKWLAFGLTGGIFALAKTLPSFHALFIQIAETILRFPVGWVRDPSDLMALISLLAGWWYWERRTVTASSRPLAGWAALSFAALLTIANAPAQDYGIVGLCAQDHTIIASASWSARFSSEDGGLSWNGVELYNGDWRNWQSVTENGGSSWREQESPITITNELTLPLTRPTNCSNPHTDPTNSNILYRYTPGVVIERSDDAGQTWHPDFNLSPASQAEQASYKRRNGMPTFRAGPLDALVDSISGNVIFAMGHEGLLVRKPTAEWIWVPVGYYRRMGLESALSLLVGEMMLALGFGLLSIVTLMQRFREKSFTKFVLTLGWVLWGFNVLVQPALISQPFSDIRIEADLVLLVLGCIILVFLGIGDVIEIASQNRNLLIRIGVVGLSGALLFFFPYALWVINIYREYNYAMVLAFILVAATLFVGTLLTRGFISQTKTITPLDK